MTAGSREEAEKVGKALVEARLAACANVIEGMRSIFWWQGGLDQEEEVVLLAKTKQGLVEALTAKVREVHGYDTPCVLALPVVGGDPEFLAWIEEETR
jgi:periplasmic divalent cation tolerance protein